MVIGTTMEQEGWTPWSSPDSKEPPQDIKPGDQIDILVRQNSGSQEARLWSDMYDENRSDPTRWRWKTVATYANIIGYRHHSPFKPATLGIVEAILELKP